MSIEQAWRDWVAFEQAFQRKNIATIREHPTTSYRDVSREALGSLSRAQDALPELTEHDALLAPAQSIGAFHRRDSDRRAASDVQALQCTLTA